MKQYSSVQHFIYNRFADGFSQKQIKDQIKSLNNIQLMNSWFIQCAFYDIPQKEKVIFGGKKNYFDRLKGKITKEQFKLNKLSSIYSIGEIVNKSVKSNRFFHLEQDLCSIIFKPNKDTRIQLSLVGIGNRISILKKLYQKQDMADLHSEPQQERPAIPHKVKAVQKYPQPAYTCRHREFFQEI